MFAKLKTSLKSMVAPETPKNRIYRKSSNRNHSVYDTELPTPSHTTTQHSSTVQDQAMIYDVLMDRAKRKGEPTQQCDETPKTILSIAERPESIYKAFRSDEYLIISRSNLLSDHIKGLVSVEEQHFMDEIFNLLLREDVKDGLAKLNMDRLSKQPLKQKDKNQTMSRSSSVESRKAQKNPLNSSSVEDFFKDTGGSRLASPRSSASSFSTTADQDTATVPFAWPKGGLNLQLKDPEVLIHRVTKQTFVRKVDGRVYCVVHKVPKPRMPSIPEPELVAVEDLGNESDWEVLDHCGDVDDRDAQQVRKKTVMKRRVASEEGRVYDDCNV